MAFSLDREAAARRLGVSTRTIDRHIRSGKVQTRRIGKKLFLEENDVEALRMDDPARKEEDYMVILSDEPVIIEEKIEEHALIQKNSQEMSLALAEFTRIYDQAQSLITKKDETIQDLSFRLGKAETELESSRTLSHQVGYLEREVQKRNTILVGMTVVLVLVLISASIFLFWSRLA